MSEHLLHNDAEPAGTLAQHLRARITREAVANLGLAIGTPVWALVKGMSFDRRELGGT